MTDTTSKHAPLLNRLHEMQLAPYYATARDTLAQAERLIAQQERELASAEGYKTAFYEIAGQLGLPAMPISPAQAHQQHVMPRLRALVAPEPIWGGDGMPTNLAAAAADASAWLELIDRLVVMGTWKLNEAGTRIQLRGARQALATFLPTMPAQQLTPNQPKGQTP